MKLQTFYLSFLMVSLAHLAYGQDQPKQSNFLSFGITPFSLLDPITSTLEGVAEVQLANRFNFEAKFGLQCRVINPFNIGGTDNHYYEIKLASKYRFKEKVKRSSVFTPYLGIEFFMVNQHYERTFDSFKQNGETFSYDFSKIRRTVRGVRLKYGHIVYKNQNWVFEFYNGLGIRRVNIEHDATNVQQSDGLFNPDFSIYLDREIGKKVTLDYVFGLKVSYKLLKW